MNQILAKVVTIVPGEVISYIQVQSDSVSLKVIKSSLPTWLNVGDTVQCSFKEASVCVSKDCPGDVSIENKVPGILKETRRNDLLCELSFDSVIGKVVSLISSQSYDAMQLEEGCEATILIRGIDIRLEPVLDIYKTQGLQEVLAITKDAN